MSGSSAVQFHHTSFRAHRYTRCVASSKICDLSEQPHYPVITTGGATGLLANVPSCTGTRKLDNFATHTCGSQHVSPLAESHWLPRVPGQSYNFARACGGVRSVSLKRLRNLRGYYRGECVRWLSFAPRWRSPMWSAQAAAEGLTLRGADNKAGYFGVNR